MEPASSGMEFPTLTTERLHLRRLTHDDADAVWEMYGDEQVLRFLGQQPITSRERAIEIIDRLNEHFDSNQSFQWAVVRKDSGVMIGLSDAFDWDRRDRHIDIGYVFARSIWGKGFATEATRAITGWAFDTLDVHRIQADITEGNIASERVLIKCGFTAEGVWRESCWEHERFVNIKQFGLLRREYEALNPA